MVSLPFWQEERDDKQARFTWVLKAENIRAKLDKALLRDINFSFSSIFSSHLFLHAAPKILIWNYVEALLTIYGFEINYNLHLVERDAPALFQKIN